MIILKKKSFNHTLLDKYKNDLKRKWGVINDILGRKKKNGNFHSIYVNGILTKDSATNANGFNNFFSEIPKTFHDKLPKMYPKHRFSKCLNFLKQKRDSKFLPKKHINSMFLSPTSPDEICAIISKFQNKSSTGLDGISAKVLKLLPHSLINCLTHIFNLSLANGKFIDSFKTSFKSYTHLKEKREK